jgi:hypothetical protein
MTRHRGRPCRHAAAPAAQGVIASKIFRPLALEAVDFGRRNTSSTRTRPTLYGAVAGGLSGVKKAIDIFRSEIDLVMGQIGCPSLDQLGPGFPLWREDWAQNR